MIDAPPACLSCTAGKEIVALTADEAGRVVTAAHPRWRISNRVAAVRPPAKSSSILDTALCDIDRATLAVTSRFRPSRWQPKVQSGKNSVVAPPAGRKP